MKKKSKFNALKLTSLLFIATTISGPILADDYNGDDGPANSSHLTCLDSPIENLKGMVRNTDNKFFQNHFRDIQEDQQFKKRLDFNVVMSETSRYVLIGPKYKTYQSYFDQYITMLIIKGAYIRGEDDVIKNYSTVMKSTLLDKPSDEMAGAYIDLNYEITNNHYGTEVLGVYGAPTSQAEVKKVIRNLDQSELCENGSLVTKKRFMKLVKSKISNK